MSAAARSKDDRVEDHVLSVEVVSLADGTAVVYPLWRDLPTEEQRNDDIACTYGVFDRMAVAAWLELEINAALERARKRRAKR